MAFFARPQSASAAVKIVAPSTVSGDPTKTSPKKDSTQRQCRNILIYGLYLFSSSGELTADVVPDLNEQIASVQQPHLLRRREHLCLLFLQVAPVAGANQIYPGLNPKRLHPPAKLSQAVNAPVFVPRSSSLPPASPTLSRAQAQTPPPASLSTSPPATEYDEHDPYDPNYYISSDNNGLYNMYTAETVVPQMQALDVNPYDKLYESQFQPEYDQSFEYYPPQSTFIRQPLNYHLYAHPPPSPPPSHFISPNLHTDLLLRSEIVHTAPAPGLNLPDEIQGYHTLVPLESTTGERRKFGNWYSTVYRATGKDSRSYVLRRVSDFRLAHQAAFQSIEQWSQLRHPNIVPVHEAFTTRSFGDNCPSVTHFSWRFLNQSQHSLLPTPTIRMLKRCTTAHIKPRPPTFVHGRLQVAQPHVPERTLWSYIIQIAGAMKAAHDQGLAVRMIDVTKVIVTGRNRVRISSCGLADVLTYNPASPGVSVSAAQIQEDLVMFGKLIMSLCCNNVAATSNFAKSLEVVTQHYSADLKNSGLLGANTRFKYRKHIGQLFDMIGSRLLTEMDDLQNGMDFLEGQLLSELENARLYPKLSFCLKLFLAGFARDSRWSETGDRYIIKLFRDYVFHQVDERGRPVLSLSHLDAGTEERVMLVSRDEQSVLVVSYKDIKACVASAFAELSQR
ncbi:hypothetical protein H4582DRAFT_2079614 [Lactarius indigo]|nr:hypothetical protein H4582DRAFT_2079614 [Lactarius indigo]